VATTQLQHGNATTLDSRSTIRFDLLEMETKRLAGFAVRDFAHATEVGGLAAGTRVPVAVLLVELGLTRHCPSSE